MQAIMSTPFDGSIAGFCRDALQISLRRPRTAAFFARAARDQGSAAKRRVKAAGRGVPVPPLMILSLTRRCNLRCQGCFVQEQHREAGGEMTLDQVRALLTQAHDLGVSIVALAGGEPLTRPDVLEITRDFPQILFPLITNASLLDDRLAEQLRKQPNVIPIISVEGYEGDTDGRRGAGVFRGALAAMERMSKRRMFFGASIMVTRQNYPLVTGREFVGDLVRRGCRMFFYVDYVPIKPQTERLVPTDRQRKLGPLAMSALRAEFPALFVASSASEEAYGGCMAAGKGFIHVSPEGNLEPCPFAPFSDTSLRGLPLSTALRSPFLRKIRESDEHLSESAGGCALWRKREWLGGLLQEQAGSLSRHQAPPGEESECCRIAA